MSTTLTAKLFSPQRPVMSIMNPRLLGVLITVTPHLFSSPVLAIPFRANGRLSQKRATGSAEGSSSTAPIKIWIPILVVALVLAGLATLTWTRASIRRFIENLSPGPTVVSNSAGATQSTRELTAEQLAGSLNRNPGTDAGGTAGRTRRTRRARRTPSQISTTSLPAYNKEPGDQELVIFRGPQDMEDMPTAVVMPPVDEDAESSLHSRDDSQTSMYAPMPTTPNDMPLLQNNDNSADLSGQNLAPQGDGVQTRRSFDTMDSAETSSLMRVSTGSPVLEADPRGEAPAYFEVVDPADNDIHTNTNSDGAATALPPQPTPTPPPEQAPPRRSGFRSLLHAIGNPTHGRSSGSTASQRASGNGATHSRVHSGPSAISSDGSDPRAASQSRTSHHPSPSTSSSFLNMSGFRSLSRPKSTSNLNNANSLNSPSLISLNSISAPLPHTLVRTEFTYPKSGPTPEQLKLISSRESFARFGMPYGPAAIAYAASASKQELEAPPPDFDTLGSDTHLPRSAGVASPSRLRVASDASDVSDVSPAEPTEPTRRSPSPQTTASPSNSTPPALPSLSPPPTGSAEVPSTGSPLPSPSTNSLPATALPPTSFKAPSIAPGRSESRATTYSTQSYATAAESFVPSTPGSESDSDFPSSPRQSEPPTPTTPKLVGRHLLEPTGVTVTQVAIAGPAQA